MRSETIETINIYISETEKKTFINFLDLLNDVGITQKDDIIEIIDIICENVFYHTANVDTDHGHAKVTINSI